MALGDGQNWDETNPQQSTLANQEDSYNRDLRVGTRLRMSQEHIWPAIETGASQAGYHVYMSLQAQTTAPTVPIVSSITQAGIIYASQGGAALNFVNSAGTIVPIISNSGNIDIFGAIYSATGTQGDLIVGASNGQVAVLPAGPYQSVLVSNSNTAAATWVSYTASGLLGVQITDYVQSHSTGTAASIGLLKIVYGQTGTIAGNSSINITGLPFTNGTSYSVMVGPYSGFNMTVSGKSASQFTLTNTHNDDVGSNGNGDWMAIGY